MRVVGRRVVIEGEVLTPMTGVAWLRSNEVYDKGLIFNMASLSPLTLQYIARKIQEDVSGTFAPDVKARVVNGQILVEGTVDSKEKTKMVENIANMYLPDIKTPALSERDPSVAKMNRPPLVVNVVEKIPPQKRDDKMVRVTMHYVELSKDYVNGFGFKWRPGITEQANLQIGKTEAGAPGVTGSGLTATISNLSKTLVRAASGVREI